ncbi:MULTISPECIES: Mov34/MPN/PAD-1 family protein [Halorussus]|uniref:Mov34/MPN/PAD-1 family protein n=1 Tax=Halorussus TaxID=1070314 RepID=UPI0020A22D03|nr:Mov34/MPN/PAD-1 family protein [Halorussus vallis]USZ75526.1 Mov34/MPN/PAD-1 family protein [Halorussus vallis]
MRLFRSSEILGIAEEALQFALEASEDSHPHEYMGFLRGEDARSLGLERDGTVITDVLVIPGTESNSVSATVKTSQIPNDSRGVGSVHSHPNGVLQPSDADLATFGRGKVHIIIGYPYERDDWRAFDNDGQPRDLDVLDVSLPEGESFFDFTQADIDAEMGYEYDRERDYDEDTK